jgi:hypothetical protein
MRSTTVSGFEVPRLSFHGLKVMDGAGWAPRVGSRIRLLVFTDHFDIGIEDGSLPPSSVRLATLQDMSIDGHLLTKGGGFWGGGFGVTGAVEGMAIASVLNSLTTKTQKWVTVAIVADDGRVDLQIEDTNALAVRDSFRVFADAISARRSRDIKNEQSKPELDVVSALERLVALRDSGSLSDGEFQLAKQRMLQSPE